MNLMRLFVACLVCCLAASSYLLGQGSCKKECKELANYRYNLTGTAYTRQFLLVGQFVSVNCCVADKDIFTEKYTVYWVYVLNGVGNKECIPFKDKGGNMMNIRFMQCDDNCTKQCGTVDNQDVSCTMLKNCVEMFQKEMRICDPSGS